MLRQGEIAPEPHPAATDGTLAPVLSGTHSSRPIVSSAGTLFQAMRDSDRRSGPGQPGISEAVASFNCTAFLDGHKIAF
jgi:hypothetical protein